jgi:hypothetical protein
MNWHRLTLHSIAIAVLALVAVVIIWFGWYSWLNRPLPRQGISYTADQNVIAVQVALQYFYKVYGRWPSSWSEVRNSKLFQRDLKSLNKRRMLIDPDDGRLDFLNDIVYLPGTAPQVLVTLGGRKQKLPLTPPTTYKYSLPTIEKAAAGFRAQGFLSNEARLIRLGILGQLNTLTDANGANLPNLESMLKHPSSPIDKKSVNPVTGSPFKFDGSPNDIWVREGVPGSFHLIPILDDGVRPNYFFTP